MNNKRLKVVTIVLSLVVISIIIFTIVTYNKKETIKRENITRIGLKIIVDEKECIVNLANNDTVLAIQKELPFSTLFTKYADSVYYAKLNKNIDVDGEIVSTVKEKGVYYHTGWQSIVIAYKKYTFKKQKLVYLGSINENIPSTNSIQTITLKTKKDS